MGGGMSNPYRPQIYVPLRVVKWLDGSTRDELAHDERAIFADFLCLAAKNGGYIAANVDDGVPYSTRRLAKLLGSGGETLEQTEALIERTIKNCVKHHKIKRLESGVLWILKWKEYQLSDSYVRVLKHRRLKEEGKKEKERKEKLKKDVTQDVTPVTQDVTGEPRCSAKTLVGLWRKAKREYLGPNATVSKKEAAQITTQVVPEFPTLTNETHGKLMRLFWRSSDDMEPWERDCVKVDRSIGCYRLYVRRYWDKQKERQQRRAKDKKFQEMARTRSGQTRKVGDIAQEIKEDKNGPAA